MYTDLDNNHAIIQLLSIQELHPLSFLCAVDTFGYAANCTHVRSFWHEIVTANDFNVEQINALLSLSFTCSKEKALAYMGILQALKQLIFWRMRCLFTRCVCLCLRQS
jgi:hypothetical protein